MNNQIKSYGIKTLAIIVSLAVSNGCSKDEVISIDETRATVKNYVMIATGQTVLYNADGSEVSSLKSGDAFYGQDANYLKGATMSYKDNSDGTVTDLNTGLIWQQSPSSSGYTWQQAVNYCNTLELGGYTDWRMPSCKELYSISNFATGWPYLNTTFFHLANGVTKDEQYWSSNYYVGITVEGGQKAAFGVNHVTGHIKAYAAESMGPAGGKKVRAVRGGNYGINEFVNNGNGTITDNSTGLMWAQSDSGGGIDWSLALAYAENSTLAGYSDWRLPNVKELQGIVDYTKSPSATDASKVGPAIDSMFICSPIINEAGNNDYGYYWTSTSAHFTTGYLYYYAWYVAFGMAVNDAGEDFHGAGAVRFDTKEEGGPLGEGGERHYNLVRLVRNVK